MLEVCIDNYQSAINAIQGGAQRLEVCSDLSLGGLSPDPELVTAIRQVSDIDIHVMLRCRAGNFRYTESEMQVHRDQLAIYKNLPIQGIVFGCLDDEQVVDEPRLRQIKDLCGDLKLVFHRAIDDSVDIFQAFQSLTNSGVLEVLTSGGKPTAIEGLQTLKNLQDRFGDKIDLLIGSGVSQENCKEIVETTGVKRIHGSFSTQIIEANAQVKLTLANHVEQVAQILDSMSVGNLDR